jgi:taurine dioxygenase
MTAVMERQQIGVRPTGAAIAADVEGVDLAGPLSAEALAAIKQAWGDHLVLRFRGHGSGPQAAG